MKTGFWLMSGHKKRGLKKAAQENIIETQSQTW